MPIGVGDGTGVGDGVGDGAGVGDGTGVGVGDGAGVGVGDGAGVGELVGDICECVGTSNDSITGLPQFSGSALEEATTLPAPRAFNKSRREFLASLFPLSGLAFFWSLFGLFFSLMPLALVV